MFKKISKILVRNHYLEFTAELFSVEGFFAVLIQS